MTNPIYLDYNATTPPLKDVKDVVWAILEKGALNPSSIHASGREGRKIIENARHSILKAIHAESHELVFTASGSEANNLALKGVENADYLVVSSIEHASVLKAALGQKQKPVEIIPVDENGVINITTLKEILSKGKGKPLVSIMLANNETGVIQPIEKLGELVYPLGGFVHTDATQALGKIPLDFTALNVDMMTLSAHKCGGVLGAAALVFKKGLKLVPQTIGGGQERGLRAGTENIAAIAGFGMAAERASLLTSELRDDMEEKILSIASNAVIHGKNAKRLPNTSIIEMSGVSGEMQLIAFDLAGIAVSSGAACSSGKVEPSHVLQAMGVSKERAACAIRVSLGKQTTREEMTRFVETWKNIYQRTNINKKAA